MSEDVARGRAPSIRDVAAAAGVSYQTVSRVLNDHPSIRPTTKARVQEEIERLAYRPNRAARILVTKRTHTIGLLISTRAQYGPFSAAVAIELEAQARGYTIASATIDPSVEGSIAAALNVLVGEGVDGLVIMAPQTRAHDALRQMAIGVPWVTLQWQGPTEAHGISIDQMAGARAATAHLIDLGHRRIVHLAGPQDWSEAEDRMLGFLSEMSDRDLPPSAPILGNWTAEFGYRAGMELLRFGDCTAIFASNDQMALGVLHAARESGIDVPRQLSVVGFDDIPEARYFAPPLTTVRQDFAELGRRAIAALLGEIEQPGSLGALPPLEAPLILRASTAPPAA